jgi:hypothetical protein
MEHDTTIQSLWIGDRLSRIELLSIQSFLANGPDYHLYVYSDIQQVPAGVVLKDAASILPRSCIFTTGGSLSIFSDWFRQELLFARGGYWVDLDMVCLKPLRFDDPIVVGKEDASKVSNALMRFPKEHEITRTLADVSKEPNRSMPYDTAADKRRKLIRKYLLGNRRNRVEWGEPAGPPGLTKILKHRRLLKIAKPYYYFCPIHFSFWRCVWDDTFRDGLAPFQASYCIHLWNEKMRRAGAFDKDGPFPRHSLVHQLAVRYGV